MTNRILNNKKSIYWFLVFIGIILLICGKFIINIYTNKSTDSINNNQKFLSPEEVVKNHLLAEKDEEYTFSLVVQEVNEIDKSHYVWRMKDSKKWNERGWSEENLAVVEAYYVAYYDNTKVPFNSGKLRSIFYLSRKNKNSPWIVHDALTPYNY